MSVMGRASRRLRPENRAFESAAPDLSAGRESFCIGDFPANENVV
jgi:hypothetical protein